MHISEGVLSAPVLAGGILLTVAGTAIGLKKMEWDRIPEVAILTAGFFVASLIHIPVGPTSVHLVLNGLMGLLLGWAAAPAILVGLTLQAVFFSHGGITTLGTNTVIMGLPAVLCGLLFSRYIRNGPTVRCWIMSFTCGALATLMGALLVGVALVLTTRALEIPSLLIIGVHLILAVIEGAITAYCIVFLRVVKPELLELGNEK
jgi:cobalt/nickel transport system permease protein